MKFGPVRDTGFAEQAVSQISWRKVLNNWAILALDKLLDWTRLTVGQIQIKINVTQKQLWQTGLWLPIHGQLFHGAGFRLFVEQYQELSNSLHKLPQKSLIFPLLLFSVWLTINWSIFGSDFLGSNGEAKTFLSRNGKVIIRMRGLPFDSGAKEVVSGYLDLSSSVIDFSAGNKFTFVVSVCLPVIWEQLFYND